MYTAHWPAIAKMFFPFHSWPEGTICRCTCLLWDFRNRKLDVCENPPRWSSSWIWKHDFTNYVEYIYKAWLNYHVTNSDIWFRLSQSIWTWDYVSLKPSIYAICVVNIMYYWMWLNWNSNLVWKCNTIYYWYVINIFIFLNHLQTMIISLQCLK